MLNFPWIIYPFFHYHAGTVLHVNDDISDTSSN